MPRPRKNIHLHQLAGTYRPDRHRALPLTPAAPPRAPSWLGDPARAKWREAARTALDLDALAVYCATWAACRGSV